MDIPTDQSLSLIWAACLLLPPANSRQELASLAGSYAVFHQMNSSPWFRYQVDQRMPVAVDLFYVAAEKISPEGAQKMVEQDIAFAKAQQLLQQGKSQ